MTQTVECLVETVKHTNNIFIPQPIVMATASWTISSKCLVAQLIEPLATTPKLRLAPYMHYKNAKLVESLVISPKPQTSARNITESAKALTYSLKHQPAKLIVATVNSPVQATLSHTKELTESPDIVPTVQTQVEGLENIGTVLTEPINTQTTKALTTTSANSAIKAMLNRGEALLKSLIVAKANAYQDTAKQVGTLTITDANTYTPIQDIETQAGTLTESLTVAVANTQAQAKNKINQEGELAESLTATVTNSRIQEDTRSEEELTESLKYNSQTVEEYDQDGFGNLVIQPSPTATAPTSQSPKMVVVVPDTPTHQEQPIKTVKMQNLLHGIELSDKLITMKFVTCPQYQIFQSSTTGKLVIELAQTETNLTNTTYADNPVFQAVSFANKLDNLQVIFRLQDSIEILANYLDTDSEGCQLILRYHSPLLASLRAAQKQQAVEAEAKAKAEAENAAKVKAEAIAKSSAAETATAQTEMPAKLSTETTVKPKNTAKVPSTTATTTSKIDALPTPATPATPQATVTPTPAPPQAKTADNTASTSQSKVATSTKPKAIAETTKDNVFTETPPDTPKSSSFSLDNLIQENVLAQYQPSNQTTETETETEAEDSVAIDDLIQENALDPITLVVLNNQSNTTATETPTASKPTAVKAPATTKPATKATTVAKTTKVNNYGTGAVKKTTKTTGKAAAGANYVLAKKPAKSTAPKSNNSVVRKRNSSGRKLIVLDAGHGGKDPGAVGYRGTKEKYLTLKYVEEIRDRLRSKYGDKFTIVLTRDRDIFIPLSGRVKIARDNQADLFISIHADSSTNREARGMSIYTLSTTASDKETAKLAARENAADRIGGISFDAANKTTFQILLDLSRTSTVNSSNNFAEIVKDTAKRHINLTKSPHRYAGFTVLTAPDIPSALIEIGFVSNSRDETLLKTSNYRHRVADAVVESIYQYFYGK